MENNRLLLKTSLTRSYRLESYQYFHIMRTILFTLIISLLACTSNAQARKADSAGNRGNYLYLNGLISDMDIASGSEKPLPYSQVVIFQNNELYVSFYGGKDGSYSFFLPLGFEYEIRYGNSTFVNKKLALDATQIDEDDKPRNIRMDVALFKPVEGADFSILNEPYARLIYDPELDAVRSDEEYSRKRKPEIDRSIKRAKKLIQASEALAEGMN